MDIFGPVSARLRAGDCTSRVVGRRLLQEQAPALIAASAIAVGRDALGHWLRDAESKASLPKLDGSLWHAYRRSWATSRKNLPVVDFAAAGGWSDVSTLLNCYQQADKETLLEVMSHSRKIRDQAKMGVIEGGNSPQTHPGPFSEKNPCNAKRCRALLNQSGRPDLNRGPPAPKAGAIPGYATPRDECKLP